MPWKVVTAVVVPDVPTEIEPITVVLPTKFPEIVKFPAVPAVWIPANE